MTKRLAFGTLLLVSTQLVSPAALAQDANTTPSAPAQTQPDTQAEPQAEETVDVSAPGFDADAVMFELQDQPCVHQADVDLAQRTAWVSHSTMIAAEDIAAALAEAGYEVSTW